MNKFIFGEKIGMSEWWNEKEEVEPITLIGCERLYIFGKRTKEKDGYSAVILGLAKKDEFPKEEKEKKKRKLFKHVFEFRVDENDTQLNVGDKVNVTIFNKGDLVKVTGLSKGKGYQGVVKKHGFSGGPKTHGHRHVLRSAGSIGSAFPQHVMKGKKMAGRMGNVQRTVKNLKIAWIDTEKNIVAIKGAVPGRRGNWVKITG